MKRKSVGVKTFVGLIIFTFLLLTINNAALAKELEKPEEKKFFGEISITPLGLTYGTGKTGSLAYEIVFEPDLGIEGEILLTGSQKLDGWEWRALFFGLAITVKRYIKLVAPTGIWYGGSIGVIPIVMERGEEEGGAHLYFILSGNIGYKWLVGEKFTLEPSLKLNYYIGSGKIGAETFPLGGLRPVVSLSLGYAF